MATKTIPQLTLRASLTDASMFEIDDGIQSYRITATQIVTYLQTKELITAAAMIASGVVTEVKLASDAVSTAKLVNLAVTNAKMDESYIHDLTAVVPVAADYLALADASDSNKKKKASVKALRNAVYRSVTSTDSVGVDDETMKMSGASFTSTLPTAVGVEGKRYKYIHAGTSISQVYTIATTSSQTIGGVAGGSYKLCTNGEVLEIESDGANWIIVGRHTKTALSTPQTLTLTASGSAPVKGTMAKDQIAWVRDGEYAVIWVNFQQTSGGTANSGTYGYRVTLPDGLTADTTICEVNTSTNSTTVMGIGALNGVIRGNLGTSGGFIANAVMYDSTTFRICGDVGSGGFGIWGLTLTLVNGTVTIVGNFRVKIADWRP